MLCSVVVYVAPGWTTSGILAVLVADVAVPRQMPSLPAVSFRGHLGDAGGRDPAIVEVEKRAGSDGEVNRFVVPSGGAYTLDIGGRNGGQIEGYLRHEAKHRLVVFLQGRRFEIVQYALDKRFPAEQFG